jgi:hypothetical protein
VGWLSWLGWLGWLGRAGAGLRQAGAAVRPRPCRRPQPGDKPICVERRQLKEQAWTGSWHRICRLVRCGCGSRCWRSHPGAGLVPGGQAGADRGPFLHGSILS